jgi:hypothetical protein
MQLQLQLQRQRTRLGRQAGEGAHRDLAEALLAEVRRPEDALHAEAEAEHLGHLHRQAQAGGGDGRQAVGRQRVSSGLSYWAVLGKVLGE